MVKVRFKPPVPMKPKRNEMNNANELRLVAADIIHKLWKAGENSQLTLLMLQAQRSLEELNESSIQTTSTDETKEN